MIKPSLFAIALAVTISFTLVFAQIPAANPLHGTSNIPIGRQSPSSPIPIKNAEGPKVFLSGVVNVSRLPEKTERVYSMPPHPPFPINARSYQAYEEELKSGKIPLEWIPVVKDIPLVTPGQPATMLRVSGTKFVGFEQNMTNQPYPPDVQVAAGNNDVMEMVNLEGGIWTKGGAPVKQFPLDMFFSLSPTHLISDPRVIYDQQSGRWFAEIMDQTSSTISIAVSQTGDPAGTWSTYMIQYSDPCIDFPKIGTSNDKFVVSTNDFTSGCQTFTASEMVVLDKDQLVGHGTYVGSSDLTDPNFSVTPARSLSPTSPLFMVANNPSVIGNTLTVYKLEGPAEYVQVSTNFTGTSTMQADAPFIPQNGTSVLVSTPPHGFEDAAWSQGKIWSAFTDACRPAEGFAKRVYSCVHVFGYNTTTGNSIDFEVTNSDYNFSYPAVSVDGHGAMYLTFNGVSSRSYPSIYATVQTRYDLPNSVEPMVEVAQGSNYDTSCRYGDYFGAASDPADPDMVWIAGEYHRLSGEFLLQNPCGGSISSPAWSTLVASLTAWNSTQHQGGLLP